MTDAKKTQLSVRETKIPGLLYVDLVIHGDNRGWFKESYQREKLMALGLPDFDPVQNNLSFNAEKGVTRGIHAEPWNKYISLASGKVFAAIVDLREGDSFGVTETFELTVGNAIYVPKGCGNSFQTLEPNVLYSYLVDDHWSPEAKYTYVNLFDEQLGIEWPIAREDCVLSDKDLVHPPLSEVVPAKF